MKASGATAAFEPIRRSRRVVAQAIIRSDSHAWRECESGGYGYAGRGDANPAAAKAVGMKRIDV
ncbi:hypothetical protein WJ03_13535 [Burkholderia vietnamiensis]|nr:hypothetical protein WJ03_13535 [Burkholderia vietnamiensis]